jgi:hypothetical protein
MKISQALFLFIILFSCKKEESSPNPSQFIVEKWWCAKPGTSTIASQLFNKNGTWEQGSKGGKFNDSGKWALSADNKKIVISSITDYNKKAKSGWEYSIESVSETNLLMNWTGLGVKMDLEVCK